ncbi:MAG: C40 family peptidase [Deltaproteobacteria bacterium]
MKSRRVIAATLVALAVPLAVHAAGRSARIRSFANRWLGTRYQWGGTGRSGIDCSAYLRQMYRDLFNIELPRTTRQQIRLGLDLPIDPTNLGRTLLPGDLIFYVDRAGVPNHVVVYLGGNLITHSVSGRGVVVDPIRKVYGRRIVARRFLVPRGGGSGGDDGGGFAPIPAAGPIVAKDIPCPPSFKPKRSEVRRYANRPLPAVGKLGERAICDFRALADALEKRGGKHAKRNAVTLDEYAKWLESIEALKGVIDGD